MFFDAKRHIGVLAAHVTKPLIRTDIWDDDVCAITMLMMTSRNRLHRQNDAGVSIVLSTPFISDCVMMRKRIIGGTAKYLFFRMI